MSSPDSNGRTNGVHISRAMLAVMALVMAGMGGVGTAIVWAMTLGRVQGEMGNRMVSVEAELASRRDAMVQHIALRERVEGHTLRLTAIEADIDRLDARIWVMRIGCKP